MDELSLEQEALLEELILKYRELGEQIKRYQELRAEVAKRIVEISCPFKIGDLIYVPKPIKRFNEPEGVCQVVDIIPMGHNSDAKCYQNQPSFIFTVRKILKTGQLSNITYTTYMPSRWRKVKAN
ncbi:MAG: hypothetical protein FD167_4916 [bacterium]|nr:MAG: hypothetical protein FD167_4916 [bacterium]